MDSVFPPGARAAIRDLDVDTRGDTSAYAGRISYRGRLLIPPQIGDVPERKDDVDVLSRTRRIRSRVPIARFSKRVFSLVQATRALVRGGADKRRRHRRLDGCTTRLDSRVLCASDFSRRGCGMGYFQLLALEAVWQSVAQPRSRSRNRVASIESDRRIFLPPTPSSGSVRRDTEPREWSMRRSLEQNLCVSVARPAASAVPSALHRPPHSQRPNVARSPPRSMSSHTPFRTRRHHPTQVGQGDDAERRRCSQTSSPGPAPPELSATPTDNPNPPVHPGINKRGPSTNLPCPIRHAQKRPNPSMMPINPTHELICPGRTRQTRSCASSCQTLEQCWAA